jgi:hypothetical protein
MGDVVSLVLPALQQEPAVERLTAGVRTRLRWAVPCCYLLGALALTWRLWLDPAARVQVGDAHDVDLFAWFMRYEATAVAHARLPALATAAMNAPHGVSLMWNTSLLLPGVLLAPVTLLAGPQTTLTVVLTLGFAGSAATLFLVLRRWGASVSAAALGGAVYGFSPALLNSGIGHYNLQFAVLPPLIIDALLRIVTGRGSVIRNGAWLGVLAAAQLFTGEELLTDTAVACLVLAAVVAAGNPRAAAGRVRDAAAGLATAAVVMLTICGRALWDQFHGPLAEHFVPKVTPYTGFLYAHPAVFVTAPGNLLLHTPQSAAAAAGYPAHLSEYLAYLGWPMLAAVAAAAVCFRRDPRVRATIVTFAVLSLCSLGGRYRGIGPFLPWHWLQGMPVLSEVLPDRFAILADGAAAAALAFSLDRARPAAMLRWGWRGGRLATAGAALAVLPLIPLPFPAARAAPVPAGWQTAFGRLELAADAPVLVVPIPDGHQTEAMRWQADTGEPGSLIGGFFLGPDQAGRTSVSPGPASAAARYLDRIWAGRRPAPSVSVAQIRADLARCRPAAVVAVARRGSRLYAILTTLFGRPSFGSGALIVWRQPAGGRDRHLI